MGIDAKNGEVAIEGWGQGSGVAATELAKKMADFGVETIIYTDISRDGMLSGVNVEATAALARACGVPIIASGGVASIEEDLSYYTIAYMEDRALRDGSDVMEYVE